MRNERVKKIIIASLFLFLVLFSSLGSTVNAAVNEKYSQNVGVIEGDLDKKMKNSLVFEALASFVYGLGSWVEKLVGDVFYTMTGESMFPWADKVIFNTIPLLDVNFLNPSKGSLFLTTKEDDTILAKIVRNIYFTIFVLAISFLGAVVGIMAIKLALSSIASEKAKYKEAMVKFLVSLVLIFTMHYAISFVFFVNEQMVIVASQILKDNLQEVKLPFDFTPGNEEVVDEFLEKNNGKGGLSTLWNWTGFFGTTGDTYGDSRDYIASTKKVNGVSNKVLAGFLLNDRQYADLRVPDATGGTDIGFLEGVWRWHITAASEETNSVAVVAADVAMIRSEEGIKKLRTYIQEYKNSKNWKEFNTTTYCHDLMMTYQDKDAKDCFKIAASDVIICKKLVEAYDVYIAKTASGESQGLSIISDMGLYFKESAWTYETDEDGKIQNWYANELTFQGAILYAIFITQSLLFFVAYIKRFFYVVILALCAPIIVIYDFVGKIVS